MVMDLILKLLLLLGQKIGLLEVKQLNLLLDPVLVFLLGLILLLNFHFGSQLTQFLLY